MMNRFSNILLIFSFFIGYACANSPREKMAEEVIAASPMQESELKDQFESDQMTQERLRAFEARAQQKLQDLADYINILKDPNLDSAFRQQAMAQALALFEDDTSTFLQKSYYEQPLVSKYIIEDIQIEKPLQEADNERYEGLLSFKSNTTTPPREAVIILKKVEKDFGDERRLIWEVLLGEIR